MHAAMQAEMARTQHPGIGMIAMRLLGRVLYAIGLALRHGGERAYRGAHSDEVDPSFEAERLYPLRMHSCGNGTAIAAVLVDYGGASPGPERLYA